MNYACDPPNWILQEMYISCLQWRHGVLHKHLTSHRVEKGCDPRQSCPCYISKYFTFDYSVRETQCLSLPFCLGPDNMGVQGLSGFIANNYTSVFKQKVALCDVSLVIDGSNLLYMLNAGFTRCYGGEYPEMYAHFGHFFDNLLPLAKDVFVIMDGRSNLLMKRDTIIKRRQRYVDGLKLLNNPQMKGRHPFPLFSLNVFVHVLMEKRVKFAFCTER